MSTEFKKLLTVGAIGLFGIAGLAACDSGDTGSDSSDDTGSAEEETAEAADESTGDGTSPDAPLPAGSEIEVGDWTITVTDVELDATDAILAENEFNEAPEDGFQQALFTIEGTYNGDETGNLWLDVSAGMYAGDTFYDECANVVPGDIMEAPEVTAGGTASGAACGEIPTDQVDGALVYLEDLFSLDSDRLFVEIG